MAYLGRRGASAPLTSADIPDSSITTAKIVDGTVAEGDLAFSTATQAELDAQRTNSSITTLGTVTAGNLSNSAIVYPAGHVLQTVGDTDTGTHRSTTSSGITPVTGLSCQLTTSILNSKILISATSSMAYANSHQLIVNIKRVISGGATTNELPSATYGVMHLRTTIWGSLTGFYLDSPVQSSGTTITYSLGIKNVDNVTEVYWLHQSGFASLTIQEISS